MSKTITKECEKHGEFTTTGPAGKCPECKKEAAGNGSGGPTPAKAKDVRKFVTLDFSEYPELHERLITEAWENFRPLDMQILYIVMRAGGGSSVPG